MKEFKPIADSKVFLLYKFYMIQHQPLINDYECYADGWKKIVCATSVKLNVLFIQQKVIDNYNCQTYEKEKQNKPGSFIFAPNDLPFYFLIEDGRSRFQISV